MNSFAHPISIPIRRERLDAPSTHTLFFALLAAIALAAIGLIAFSSHSLSLQLEASQAAQVAASQQAAASGAYIACVENNGSDAAARCRAAASIFAADDDAYNRASFEKAVAFIYPQKR